MDILLEAMRELNKTDEAWQEPIIDLSDLSQYPYISHFTDSVKKLFCIIEYLTLKPKTTNQVNAICFSYFPYIEHERDPETFKYGILFNTEAFTETLKKHDLILIPYHATANRMNSGIKQMRVKDIWKKNNSYYLELTGYDFSTPFEIEKNTYLRIKNHLLYLEKVDPNYSLIKEKDAYDEYFGYAKAAKGQNVYISSHDSYRRLYNLFILLRPLLINRADMDTILNTSEDKPWRVNDCLKKYDFDFVKLGLPEVNLKRISREDLKNFIHQFKRMLNSFRNDFDKQVIWLNLRQADDIYVRTDEAEIRVKTTTPVKFNMATDVYEIYIPEEIKDIDEDKYKEELDRLNVLTDRSDMTLKELKDENIPDKVLLYWLKKHYRNKIKEGA